MRRRSPDVGARSRDLRVLLALLETRDAARELERMGAEWRTQYGKDVIVSARSHIGEVILEASAQSAEAHPAF